MKKRADSAFLVSMSSSWWLQNLPSSLPIISRMGGPNRLKDSTGHMQSKISLCCAIHITLVSISYASYVSYASYASYASYVGRTYIRSVAFAFPRDSVLKLTAIQGTPKR
jgi:hypothetical protein